MHALFVGAAPMPLAVITTQVRLLLQLRIVSSGWFKQTIGDPYRTSWVIIPAHY